MKSNPRFPISAIIRLAVMMIAALPIASMQTRYAFSEDANRPNIVLVFADDLGINDLACYGRAEHPTPNLDRLASQGARFTCAYTAQPICSPSRAAIMTGKCPARLNLTNFLPGRADAPSQRMLQPVIEGRLPLEEITLAELLRDAGYQTGLFGKWHLGNGKFGPKHQGFDVVVEPPANTDPETGAGGKGEYLITDAAIEFIEANRDRPFFCYVPHNNPHIPLRASDALVSKHKDAFHPVYAAMIETLDDSIGRLMEKIDALGITERTLFVFTSDNGGLHVLEFPGTPATHNAPFRAGKGYLYEGGLREPLIVRWPGVASPGKQIDAPVVLTDLVPTLLGAAGIDPAKTVGPLDGIDIRRMIAGEASGERELFWHFPHYTNQGSRPASAVRIGKWKLIESLEDGSAELYDLSSDASESTDLAKQHPDVVAGMKEKLQQWRVRVGAREMTPNPQFEPSLYERLYVQQDPSRLLAGQAVPDDLTAAAVGEDWLEWRAAMNQAVKGRAPRVTPASGDIRLHAKDATVHAKNMRYESEPYKNVLGFWTIPSDWAEWTFDVEKPGKYEVEVQQGCGSGSGGALVHVEIAGEVLPFTVQDTGHFQHMITRTVGIVELPKGLHRLAIKPQTKPGAAVMDVRRIVLRPAQP